MRLYFLLPVLLLMTTINLQAQGVQTQALQQLEARGVDEAEFRARMMQKGYDMDNITPEQLPELQPIIEETLAELEAEQQASNPGADTDVGTGGGGTPTTTAQSDLRESGITDTEIMEAVEEGATVEEAVSEQLIENENAKSPPPAVYGQNIFRNQTLELYRSADNIKPPDSYILGSGDDLIVSIFGRSQAEFAFTINEEGFIKPTGISRIYLRGLTLEKAKRLVEQRFSQYYSFAPEQFALTINAARTITINIFGEVQNQGSFTLSAINTAFNAMVAAGGPTDIGSVRNIKLIKGEEVRRLDVYEFLFDSGVRFDYFLEDNDVIQIPVSEKIVTIEGAVKRPYRYELIEDEDIVDLIGFAGGLNVNAYLENIQVNRIINGQRVIIDVDLTEIIERNIGFALENGDVVKIRTIPERLERFAEVEGAVEFPGKYQLDASTTVTDLLGRGILREDSRTDVVFLMRTNPDETVQLVKLNVDAIAAGDEEDVVLRRRDRIFVLSRVSYTDNYQVTVSGAVRAPRSDEFETGLTVADLVTLANGLRPDASDFAYLTRTDLTNSDSISYIRLDIREAVNNPASEENLELQPKDRLIVQSTTEFTDEFQVSVEGAVRQPGQFQYAPTLSLQDVLTLAGGLQISAASNRVDIFRVVLDENEPTKTIVATVEVDRNMSIVSGGSIELQPFDIIVVRNVPDFELQTTVVLEGEVRYPGVYALISENETIVNLIQRAGGLTGESFPEGAQLYRTFNSIGPVILDLDKALKKVGSRFNYVLKNGDRIFIPKSKDLVTIRLAGSMAAELYPEKMLGEGKLSVAYVDGKNATWYVNNYAAGINRKQRARKRLITVEHPNGQLERNRAIIGGAEVEKGSVVSIGLKPQKAPKPKKDTNKEPIEWNSIIKDFIAIAGGAATVIGTILALSRNN